MRQEVMAASMPEEALTRGRGTNCGQFAPSGTRRRGSRGEKKNRIGKLKEGEAHPVRFPFFVL